MREMMERMWNTLDGRMLIGVENGRRRSKERSICCHEMSMRERSRSNEQIFEQGEPQTKSE